MPRVSTKKSEKSMAAVAPTPERTNARAHQGKRKSMRQHQQGETDEPAASVVGQRKRQKLNSVEAEAATTLEANDEERPLTLDDAVPELQEMFNRWKQGKRQLGKRKKWDPYKSGLLQIKLLAARYRGARNDNRETGYEAASNNINFASFKGRPEELRAKEPEVIALLRRALAEKRDPGSAER
ncbi:hypothetical protein PI124_g19336 [Phytophthora idaei]|nr:hypothetical protein PI125_g21411 [Phytophthora idaei]KAG3135430.1 hypothetical protein PI126_g18259 [Phytophthora idaei]KAG3235641.1 hypothetical protein PI124_g19336 [Phytophthora idaei]